MKLQWIVPILMGVSLCLTGCGDNMTVQQDEVPVVPAETTFIWQTENRSADGTSINADIITQRSASVQTDAGKSSSTQTVTVTAQTAAAAAASANTTGGSQSGNAGGGRTANTLYGKWETVSFSKDSGASIAYDLSDPVHRSYYVGLDLNNAGQSALTVGTDSYPATAAISGSTVEVDTVSLTNPLTMKFTVSADWSRMTVELLNGRILATLKRVQSDFSIRDFLKDPPITDISVLADEWYYQEIDPQDLKTFITSAFVTIRDDGSFLYQPKDGAVRTKGTIQLDYEEHPDGSRNPLFSFHDDAEGISRFSIFCESERKDVYSVGNGGMARLIRKKPDEGIFDSYVGTWEAEGYTIQIGAQDNGYLVHVIGSDSATEYRDWTYYCTGSEDGTYLECTGGGTMVQVETAEGGTEARNVVYNDGTAMFSVRGGGLRWQGEKDSVGDLVYFMPVGEEL